MQDKTDSFYSNILLVGILAVVSIGGVGNKQVVQRDAIVMHIGSILMTVASILANYTFLRFDAIHLLPFLGCYIAHFEAINLLFSLLDKNARPKKTGEPYSWKIFAFICTLCLAAYCAYLFLGSVPGHLTVDSFMQLDQIHTGKYVNHHPFWHTMLIKICVDLGMALANDINAGIMLYSLAQGLMMSLVVAHAAMTLRQWGLRWWWIVPLCYVALPYHVVYSVTMWKDVPFGIATLLFCVSFARVYATHPVRKVDIVFLSVASALVILFRNNGIFAVLVLSAIVLVRCAAKKKLLVEAIPLLAGLLLGFLLTGPVLYLLGVSPTESVEPLSVPLQQIARVLASGKDLDEKELLTLDSFMDIGRVRESYKPWISDPVKHSVNDEWIKTHFGDFLGFWIRVGLKYPAEYAKAWIDQTRGYWNGGYQYWIWERGNYVTKEKLLGIGAIQSSSIDAKWRGGPFAKAFDDALDRYMKSKYTEPLRSIGMATWAIATFLLYAIARRRVALLYCCAFPLLVVATLCIASPVFNEFRYAYCSFTCLTFIVGMTLVSPYSRVG